jgi:hypothetical protein
MKLDCWFKKMISQSWSLIAAFTCLLYTLQLHCREFCVKFSIWGKNSWMFQHLEVCIWQDVLTSVFWNLALVSVKLMWQLILPVTVSESSLCYAFISAVTFHYRESMTEFYFLKLWTLVKKLVQTGFLCSVLRAADFMHITSYISSLSISVLTIKIGLVLNLSCCTGTRLPLCSHYAVKQPTGLARYYIHF